jgi:EAL domain-containing protein (putative c-di-GMP-specific phosphodiesterase class I)
MTVHAAFALELERDLGLALERDELVLHYQPLVEIATGRVTGAEALVRWQHPERGMVPPLEFISAAESTGQIIDIGLLVLSRACEQAVRWAAAGEAIRVSVNVAVEQLRHGDFPDAVSEVLQRTGLPPDLLCLEITESSMMRSGDERATDLTRLRELGVHLAIDDFGTGYSSLSYLHQLPVDEIKIDRSFINRLGVDPRDNHLVEAIIGLANAMDLVIVAEGVETKEHLEFLADRGCQLAQGYLFSPPLPSDAFNAYLDRQSSLATSSLRQ